MTKTPNDTPQPKEMGSTVYVTSSANGPDGVDRLLAEANVASLLAHVDHILLKPNLVSTQPPPVTTPVALVENLVVALRKLVPDCRITVAEGTGSITCDTFHCFQALGYVDMAVRQRIELVDLNTEPLVCRANKDCRRLPELYLPALLDKVFLVSVPVLKAHSMAGVTLTMKNMMGCVPPSHYRQGNSWGKSALHERLDQAIVDLNRYRTPDLTVLDGSIGMDEAHLWGRLCSPPVGLLAACTDPVAIDGYGAGLLGLDWRTIDHIRLADGILGRACPLRIVRV